MRKALWLLLLVGSMLAGTVSTSASESRHDVSYLWHRNLDSVFAYRVQVARVLGPQVAAQLKVVQRPGLYGLVYDRPGNTPSATRVVRSHTDLLRAHGLEPAGLVRAQDWNRLAVAGSQSARSVTPTASQSTVSAPTSSDLEAAVERHIKTLRRQGRLTSDERTGWSVYDFTTGEKLVTINEDERFQAASLVKPFFALAFFHQVSVGALRYDGRSKRHMQLMIHNSNNESTNWVMRQVGGPRAVDRLLKRHYSRIFEDTSIVEYIPANGRTYRNKASAHDYSRFLYALWNGGIPGATEIKRLMRLPGRDRLFTGAQAIPRGTTVYNKTGSTARLCGDMGILVVAGRDGKRYAYTLVGVIEKRRSARNYSSWIRSRGDVIRSVSNLVYREISERHGLL